MAILFNLKNLQSFVFVFLFLYDAKKVVCGCSWGRKIVSIASAGFTNLHSEIVNQMLRTCPHATAIPKTAQYSAIARTVTSCCAFTFFMITITIKDPSQSQSYLTNILSSTSERNVFLIKHKFRLFLV